MCTSFRLTSSGLLEPFGKVSVLGMFGLCSKKSPSKCRPSSPSILVNLTIEDICAEWSTRPPIFYAFLVTAGVPSRHSDIGSINTLPSIAVAGPVLLRE